MATCLADALFDDVAKATVAMLAVPPDEIR
jgi:hypothetical protein